MRTTTILQRTRVITTATNKSRGLSISRPARVGALMLLLLLAALTPSSSATQAIRKGKGLRRRNKNKKSPPIETATTVAAAPAAVYQRSLQEKDDKNNNDKNNKDDNKNKNQETTPPVTTPAPVTSVPTSGPTSEPTAAPPPPTTSPTTSPISLVVVEEEETANPTPAPNTMTTTPRPTKSPTSTSTPTEEKGNSTLIMPLQKFAIITETYAWEPDLTNFIIGFLETNMMWNNATTTGGISSGMFVLHLNATPTNVESPLFVYTGHAEMQNCVGCFVVAGSSGTTDDIVMSQESWLTSPEFAIQLQQQEGLVLVKMELIQSNVTSTHTGNGTTSTVPSGVIAPEYPKDAVFEKQWYHHPVFLIAIVVVVVLAVVSALTIMYIRYNSRAGKRARRRGRQGRRGR